MGGSRSPATGVGASDAQERVPPASQGAHATGGSRSSATEGVASDAQERVPHAPQGAYTAGGSRSSATGIGASDAQERVPPARRHPSRLSVMTYNDNRPVLLFVTVVADKRRPILANDTAHACIVEAWRMASDWLVGRYVIMPDHVHFFCSPATYPPPDFHRWMAYWKSLATKAYWHAMGGSRSPATGIGAADAQERVPPAPQGAHATGGSRSPATEVGAADAQERVPPAPQGAYTAGGSRSPATEVGAADAQERVPPARNPPLFQRECWDTQLRMGDSYSAKWTYVRDNPVRKGLAPIADAWSHQGQIAILQWHERC